MDSHSSTKKTAAPPPAGGKKRTGALLSILVLVACCAASFYVYMKTMQTVRGGGDGVFLENAPEPDVTSLTEATELETTSSEYTSMGRATSVAMRTALLAEISGKYPVAQPGTLIASPADVSAADGVIEEPVVYEPDPPQVTVTAVMISGTDRIAMIDVLGEETGIIVKQGTKFSGGEARITKISEKGVTFTWMGTSYTVEM